MEIRQQTLKFYKIWLLLFVKKVCPQEEIRQVHITPSQFLAPKFFYILIFMRINLRLDPHPHLPEIILGSTEWSSYILR